MGKEKSQAKKDLLDLFQKAEIKEIVGDEKEMVILEENQEDNALPTTEATCSKCQHALAWYWLRQMRAGDEPETKFLKCTQCKHVWRE